MLLQCLANNISTLSKVVTTLRTPTGSSLFGDIDNPTNRNYIQSQHKITLKEKGDENQNCMVDFELLDGTILSFWPFPITFRHWSLRKRASIRSPTSSAQRSPVSKNRSTTAVFRYPVSVSCSIEEKILRISNSDRVAITFQAALCGLSLARGTDTQFIQGIKNCASYILCKPRSQTQYIVWYPWRDSNARHAVQETAALST